ncbi:hypothetical protein PUN28_017070 [Cardiocondyla obscurior]|uniref:Uncharacterized protein n=1 Tax=Cardiocondyla obscurior TaxID=286306 RepID=A0AAW2ER04_9HYME
MSRALRNVYSIEIKNVRSGKVGMHKRPRGQWSRSNIANEGTVPGTARATPPCESSIASEQRGVISGCVEIPELVYPKLHARSSSSSVVLVVLGSAHTAHAACRTPVLCYANNAGGGEHRTRY